MHSTTERRSGPRATLAGAVLLTVGHNHMQGEARDLSESGMLLALDGSASARPGLAVRLLFMLPKLDAPLAVLARVVRREDGHGHVLLGVRFLGLSPEVRRILRTFVFVGQGQILEYLPLDRGA